MTDNRQWQTPGSTGREPSAPTAAPPPTAPPLQGPPPPSGPPISAVPPAPVYPAPAYPQIPSYPSPYPPAPPSPYPPPATGWTPPPRPGLVPLRPLTLGMIFAGAFGTLRRAPLATLGPALVVSLAVALVQGLGSIGFLTSTLAVAGDPSAEADPSGALGGLLAYTLSTLGSVLLGLVATSIVEGIVTLSVASGTVGERLRFGALWRRLRGRRWAVIGWAFLLAAAAAAGLLVAVLLVVALAALGGAGGVIAAVLGGIVVALGAVAAGVWLTIKLGFVPAALVVERLRLGAAITRSWRLSIGSFWRILGIRLLMAVMLAAASSIVALPVQLIATLIGTLLMPNGGTEDSMVAMLTTTTIASQAVGAIVGAVALVLNTATTGLLYVDLRMRREGLDLDLARYVEVPPAARTGLPDPFRAPERAA